MKNFQKAALFHSKLPGIHFELFWDKSTFIKICNQTAGFSKIADLLEFFLFVFKLQYFQFFILLWILIIIWFWCHYNVRVLHLSWIFHLKKCMFSTNFKLKLFLIIINRTNKQVKTPGKFIWISNKIIGSKINVKMIAIFIFLLLSDSLKMWNNYIH